jgi:hypothetical protein
MRREKHRILQIKYNAIGITTAIVASVVAEPGDWRLETSAIFFEILNILIGGQYCIISYLKFA